jgi:predicted FMN-binding regulatory protein PaiB
MSQNRDMNDRDGVVKGLGGRGKGDDLEMAEIIMRSTTAGT